VCVCVCVCVFKKKKTQENKTCNMEMISYARQDQTCEYSMMPIQKSSRSTCFFCLHQQIPAQFSQEK
jgi:hypothetical protein